MESVPRIVLLDNDEKIVELVEWYLVSKGFEVRTAASFGALEALLEGGPCDLLVSDVDLGTESALVELPRLSAAGRLPRTLVVSGFLDAANQTVLDGVPEVVDALPKPFAFEELEARVRTALQAERADAPPSSVDGTAPDPGPSSDPGIVGAQGSGPGSGPDPGPGAGAAPDAGPDDGDGDGWVEIAPPE